MWSAMPSHRAQGRGWWGGLCVHLCTWRKRPSLGEGGWWVTMLVSRPTASSP